MKAIFLFWLCLCVNCFAYESPCINELWKIHCSQYILGVNDCTDKAVNYCNILNIQGYNCNVIAGTAKRSSVPHAWVQLIIKGNVYWIDPIVGLKCKLKKDWRGRKAWYKYKKGITKQEVREYCGIIAVYKDAPIWHVINRRK